MFQHYFKTAIRNLTRQKGYSLLNVLGLSVGLMVSLLMLLWLQDEWKVNKFHKDGDRIYSWEIFLLTILMALGIAVATVSFQAIRAALSNPIEALRTE